MSTHVKKVSDVAHGIAKLNEKAATVADHLRASIDDVDQSLDLAQELSESIRGAGAELRGILGTQSNGPPRDESNTADVHKPEPGDA